jgi:hypothetical protein
VDVLNTEAHNERLTEALKALDAELATKESAINKYESELKRRMDEIEKKTREVDVLNRKLDKIIAAQPGAAPEPQPRSPPPRPPHFGVSLPPSTMSRVGLLDSQMQRILGPWKQQSRHCSTRLTSRAGRRRPCSAAGLPSKESW